MRLKRTLAAGGVAVALGVAAWGLGYAVRVALPGLCSPVAFAQAAEADATPIARAEMYRAGAAMRGKLLIGDTEILRTVYKHNGVEPYERASIAAARINLALAEGAGADDFRAANPADDWVVVAGDRVIIGIAPGEPGVYKLGHQRLAEKWATNITMALHDALGTRPDEAVALPPMEAEAQPVTVDGREAAALVVNGSEVLRITSEAAGLSPLERVGIVADRLKLAVSEGALPQDIRASSVYGMAVVQVSETLLITVDDAEAVNAGKTPTALAQEWSAKLADAVAAHYAGAGKPIKPPVEEWVPAEPYDDKWVPIVSVLEGVKVGLARVNGPRSRVRLVQAVAQLETHWKDYLEVDILIPISTKVPGKSLDRVKACGVTGIGDLKL